MTKPKFPYHRDLSWSQLSMFDDTNPYCDKEGWYQKYCVHGECKRAEGAIPDKNGNISEWGVPAFCTVTQCFNPDCPVVKTSKEMIFGSMIDKKLQDDPTFMPHIERFPHLQYKLKTKLKDIPLVGLPDNLDFDNPRLDDFKTGKGAWTQKKADETGQLTMYLLLIYLIKKIPPEKFKARIIWMPTQENGDFSISLVDPKKALPFHTTRTTKHIQDFAVKIMRIRKEMIEYHKNHL